MSVFWFHEKIIFIFSRVKQPTMGLASLRQYQANTLRRSEECLTTSSPNSSASDSEVAAANGGDHQRGSNLILDQQPVRKFIKSFLFC